MKHIYRLRILSLLLSLAAIVSLSGPVARAQDKTAEVDKIFSWVKPGEPGCTVAVSQQGKLVVNRAYGLADLERDVPLSTTSLLDVGSIRKQFVAVAVLLLVEEGKLALTDDIRKYLPQLPDYGHKVTVDHLLTHTSGIRDFQALLNLAGGDPDAMTMIARQRELNFVPGSEWGYSNSNYVLLPEIVARVSGMTFQEFVHKRLLEPAGMKMSRYIGDPLTVVKNRALAYKRDAEGWKLDMYLGNDRGGAGSLLTTAAELVAWNDALINKRFGPFVAAKLIEPNTLNNGRRLSHARAVTLETLPSGGQLVWYSGAAAGFSAQTGHVPSHGVSIAIACNLDGGARAAYASQLMSLFLPGSIHDTSPARPAGGPAGEVKDRAGLFFNEQNGESLMVGLNNNTLVVQGSGPLLTVAANRFRNSRVSPNFMSGAEFEMEFISNDQIELKTKDGITSRYKRAVRYAPTADELKAFAGRYYSDELMAVFEAAPGKEGLMVRANDSPRALIEFKPVAKDVFQAGGGMLRFIRDQNGKVTALDYSNPLLRRVRFPRTSAGNERR